jgi:DinB superfamily
MAETISVDSAGTSFDQFVGEFRETVETAASRLLELSPPESQVDSTAGKWSHHEILGHLIDSAANNHQRFVRAQFTDELVFAGYKQDDWVAVQHYNKEAWPHLVQLWRYYNLHISHVISTMSESSLSRPRSKHNLNEIAWRPVDSSESTTLEYFVRDYVGHLKHHLDQVFGDETGNQSPDRLV